MRNASTNALTSQFAKKTFLFVKKVHFFSLRVPWTLIALFNLTIIGVTLALLQLFSTFHRLSKIESLSKVTGDFLYRWRPKRDLFIQKLVISRIPHLHNVPQKGQPNVWENSRMHTVIIQKNITDVGAKRCKYVKYKFSLWAQINNSPAGYSDNSKCAISIWLMSRNRLRFVLSFNQPQSAMQNRDNKCHL